MKRRAILILSIFLLIISSSFAERINDYNDKTFLDMSFNIKGSFKLVKQSSSASISELNTNLSFVPKNKINQDISNIKTYSTPQSTITQNENNIGYTWQNPAITNYEIALDSSVKVRNSLVIINEKVNFPLENVDSYYINPTEYIDINEDIRKQAQQLAEGEDDLYKVSFKVADWVQKNIAYNLTTLTADVVEKSSWVMKNRQGVCDELTNLFISMMRSLGVPARFVSGMAYTNTVYDWGPHAWAEVYFPNKGWVPFDVTYVEYGWIDPSHIKIRESIDSGEPAIKYTWRASDVNFLPSKLDVKASLVSAGNTISKQIDLKVNPLVNNVGPGSYVPIEIELKNNNAYYFPLTLTVLKGPHLTEKNFKTVLLRPEETKRITWIAKIPSDLEENYIYKSTIEIEDHMHNKVSSQITYGNNLKIFSLDDAKALAKDSAIEDTKIISAKLEVSCSTKKTAYFYEELSINCDVKNKGNTLLENLRACMDQDCKNIAQLGIADIKTITFTERNLEKGMQNFEIIVSNDEAKASDVVRTEILSSPELDIASVIYNTKPNYNDKDKLEITLTLKAKVKELNVFVDGNAVLNASSLETPKKLIVITDAAGFAKKDKFRIYVKYKDENGKDYALAKDYPIEVINIPWYAKLLMFLHII